MPTRSEVVMGTIVTIHVAEPCDAADTAIGRAFGWFHEIESHCSRFDEHSELMRLAAQPGVDVPASAILFEAVQFALRVAEETEGAFDPTVGGRMAERGYNREHRTGKLVAAQAPEPGTSFRDVHLDAQRRTIRLNRRITLDLGAVAKGLAIDAAARELAPLRNFSIDAGGDLFLAGHNERGAPWTVGIRHPRREGELIASLSVSDRAVCTSGDYERGGHILDARTADPAGAVASATVVAPGAMLADALATAVFALGPAAGLALLERQGVQGLIITPDLKRHQTQGLAHAA